MTIYPGSKVLDLFSKYAINRNNYIAKLIGKFMRSDSSLPKKILEFGAGKGEFINRFADQQDIETHIVEADDEYRLQLAGKHNAYKTIDEAPTGFDFIFLIDVLEHLQDDEEYLKKFYLKLREGGRIFIYVPARRELFSEFDKSIGHFRRYTKKELKRKVKDAGFMLEACHYHEFPGYLASAIHNILLQKKEPAPISLKLYDQILSISNFLENILPPPIGKSLYLSAKRPNLML